LICTSVQGFAVRGEHRGIKAARAQYDAWRAKATLFIVENDADHAQAKALIEQLIGSKDPADQARMTAQARLIEAYERTRLAKSRTVTAGSADLSDGPAWNVACRSRTVVRNFSIRLVPA
jgi:hypothetical protein